MREEEEGEKDLGDKTREREEKKEQKGRGERGKMDSFCKEDEEEGEEKIRSSSENSLHFKEMIFCSSNCS